jgi:hypothetical protein
MGNKTNTYDYITDKINGKTISSEQVLNAMLYFLPLIQRTVSKSQC